MATLDYQTPDDADRTAPLTWLLVPVVVIPAAVGLSLFAALLAVHGPKLPLVLIDGPALLPLLLFRAVSDDLFVLTLVPAVSLQYTLYFAAVRSRHRGLMRATLVVHVAGAAAAYFLA